MPLTNADKEQIDAYLKNNQPHLARIVLQDHLKEDPFDEAARKVLGKINTRYPALSTPPAFSVSASVPPPVIPPVKITRPQTPITPPSQPGDDMAEIRQAIKEKRYADAEALLVLSDHPDADKLRERLAAISGSGFAREKVKNTEVPPDFTVKLSITILLLLTLTLFGLVALMVWEPEARRYPDAPGAQGLILANRIVTWILRGILALIVGFLALVFVSFALARLGIH